MDHNGRRKHRWLATNHRAGWGDAVGALCSRTLLRTTMRILLLSVVCADIATGDRALCRLSRSRSKAVWRAAKICRAGAAICLFRRGNTVAAQSQAAGEAAGTLELSVLAFGRGGNHL